MALEIRHITNVTPEIADAVARLLPQLTASYPAPTVASLQTVAASPSAAFFAAYDGERMAGMLTLVWYASPTGSHAWIEDVVVDSSARGLGAGDALVQAALAHARQIGLERVLLTSAETRQAARALYRKIGFEEVNTTVFALKLKA